MSDQLDKKQLRQEKAIAALLATNTITAAASMTGICERTLIRWLKEHDFAEAYRNARKDMLREAMAQLSQAAVESVQNLRDIGNTAAGSPIARVHASRTILQQALKAFEMEELSARMARVEAQLQELGV